MTAGQGKRRITFAVILLLAAVAGGGYIGYQVFQKMSNQSENSDGWGKSAKSTTAEETVEEPAAAESEAETNATAPSAIEPVTQPFAVPSDSSAANIIESSAAWAGNLTSAPTAPWTVNQTAQIRAPLPNNTQTQATNLPTATNSFILPDSATRYLGITDIETLTIEQLRIARNEIYARHGRKFKDSGLQTYFNAQSWYTGTIEANQFSDETMLSEIERKNLEVIQARENVLN